MALNLNADGIHSVQVRTVTGTKVRFPAVSRISLRHHVHPGPEGRTDLHPQYQGHLWRWYSYRYIKQSNILSLVSRVRIRFTFYTSSWIVSEAQRKLYILSSSECRQCPRNSGVIVFLTTVCITTSLQ